MSEENQAPPSPEGFASRPGGPLAPHPAFEFLEAAAGDRATFGPLEPAAPAPLPRGILHSALALTLLGLAALLLGQVETALLVAIAALFFVAQGADVHPAMGRMYALLAWIPPVLSAILMGALAHLLVTNRPPTPLGIGCAIASGLGALASLATLRRAVADWLVRLLFRGARPSHTLRLASCIASVTLWVALPAWFAFRDQITELLRNPADLVSPSKLSGGLVGYVVLAFASIGFMVRRDWRGALERLGLTALRPADGLTVIAGIVALWLFNLGTERFEQSALPALWASDQAFTAALAGVMGPGLMLLLSLSAGIGEEITLRGALQPKLGIALTSLLFAALHMQYSWYGMLSILVFGLLLGVIRMRSSTTAAILVHTLYNLLAVASSKP